MIKVDNSKITPYSDINEILLSVSDNIKNILGQNLIGLYLFGSLSYSDFNPDSSDIDIVAILNKPLAQQELQLIKRFHQRIKDKYPKWADRLECSYTPLGML